MERSLPRVLPLLVLLGCTAGERGREAAQLDPYGTTGLDGAMQCPAHSNASWGSSLDRDQGPLTGPGKAGAGDPSAEEASGPWALLGGVSAGEIAKQSADAGVLLMEGEQCNKWVHGKANPIETFQCPTQDNRPEMFCCGTCTAPYCCSSPKERLDQPSCSKIMGKREHHGAAFFSVTPPEKSITGTLSVLVVIGISCICVWIVMVVSYLQDQKITCNWQRAGSEPLDVVSELPASRHPASGDPDSSSRMVEESQR